jgi:hypothetical protein
LPLAFLAATLLSAGISPSVLIHFAWPKKDAALELVRSLED